MNHLDLDGKDKLSPLEKWGTWLLLLLAIALLRWVYSLPVRDATPEKIAQGKIK